VCRYTHARQFVTGATAGVEPPLRSSPVVLFSLAYAVVRLVLEALIVHGRANAELRAEVLALRHQLRVLERQAGRPRWQPCDRLLLAAISRVLNRPAWRSLLPSPETLLRWHRELVHHKWAAYRRRPRRHRPMPRSELHQLILRLARENSRWGYRRIQGELFKLGHCCSHLTVRRVLRRHGLPPAPRRGQRTWREFVRQHADLILAVDFFVVDTVWLTQLYVLFWIEVGSRRVHLAGCTYSPSGAWVVQQARNLAWKLQDGGLSARFLLRDRDAKFSAAFDEVFKSEGVEVIRLPYRAPRAKLICGTVCGNSTARVSRSPAGLRPPAPRAGAIGVPRALPPGSAAPRHRAAAALQTDRCDPHRGRPGRTPRSPWRPAP
jgi:putative transposase